MADKNQQILDIAINVLAKADVNKADDGLKSLVGSLKQLVEGSKELKNSFTIPDISGGNFKEFRKDLVDVASQIVVAEAGVRGLDAVLTSLQNKNLGGLSSSVVEAAKALSELQTAKGTKPQGLLNLEALIKDETQLKSLLSSLAATGVSGVDAFFKVLTSKVRSSTPETQQAFNAFFTSLKGSVTEAAGKFSGQELENIVGQQLRTAVHTAVNGSIPFVQKDFDILANIIGQAFKKAVSPNISDAETTQLGQILVQAFANLNSLGGQAEQILQPLQKHLHNALVHALKIDPNLAAAHKANLIGLLEIPGIQLPKGSALGRDLTDFVSKIFTGAEKQIESEGVKLSAELSKVVERISTTLSGLKGIKPTAEDGLLPANFTAPIVKELDILIAKGQQLAGSGFTATIQSFSDNLKKLGSVPVGSTESLGAVEQLYANIKNLGLVTNTTAHGMDFLNKSTQTLTDVANQAKDLQLTKVLENQNAALVKSGTAIQSHREAIKSLGDTEKATFAEGQSYWEQAAKFAANEAGLRGQITATTSALTSQKDVVLATANTLKLNNRYSEDNAASVNKTVTAIQAAIEKNNALLPVLNAASEGWKRSSSEALFSGERIKQLLNDFKSAANDSGTTGYDFLTVLTRITGAASLAGEVTGKSAQAFAEFRSQFAGLSAGGEQAANVLNTVREVVARLFTNQTGFGQIFDLKNIDAGVAQLKSLGAKDPGGKVFQKYGEDLATLQQFLKDANLSATVFGDSVNRLFTVARGFKDFQDNVFNLNKLLKDQAESTTRLTNTYGSLKQALADLNAERVKAEGLSGNALTASQVRQSELTLQIARYTKDYNREQEKVVQTQGRITTQLSALRVQAQELGTVPLFNTQAAEAETFNQRLIDTKRNFKGLNLESLGFGTQLTGGLKTAESELTAISKSLNSSFVHLRVSINTQLSAIGSGADGNVANRIKNALNKVLEAIRSGTNVEASFNELRNAFKAGFASLSGDVGQQNKLEGVFKTITKSLGDEATRLGTKLGQVGIDFPQSFAAGGDKVKVATTLVNGLNTAVTASNQALREVGQAVKTDKLNSDFTTLVGTVGSFATRLNSLSKVDGVLKDKDLETAKALQRELKDLTSQWTKLQQAPTSGILDPERFNALGTRLDFLSTKIKGLFDRSVLDNLKTAIGGIQQQFQTILPTNAVDPTALIQKLKQTGIDAAAVFKQALVGDLQKIPTAQLDKISKDIGNAIRNSTAAGDTQTRTTLIALAKDWENYKNLVVQANRVIELAANKGLSTLREGASQTGQLQVGTSFAELQGQVQAANTEAIRLRQSLTDLLSGKGGIDGKKLVADFAALASTTRSFGSDVGRTNSELAHIKNLIATIGNLKLAPQISEALLAPLRTARDNLQQLKEAKEQLDQAGTKSFGKDLERLVTLADRGTNQLNLLNTVSKDFGTSGYFSKPAEDLNKTYLQLQRMESALTNIKSGLQGQLQLGRLGSTDPALAASITQQIAALDQAIAKTQRYGQVLEQIRSGAKAEIFNRLTQGLQSVVQAAGAANQKLKSKGIGEGLTANLSAVGSTFATLSAQILNSGNALSKDLVDNFKSVSAQTKVTAKDLEAWLRVLESQKDAGVRKITLDDGSRVAVGRLIAEVKTLLTTFGKVGPAVAQADAALKSRLGSNLGQLQLKVEESINKFNLLQTSIKGLSQAGADTGTFTSLRKMLDELAKPMNVNNKFFTMGKDTYGPLRNELQQYTESLKANLNTLNLYVSTVRSSGDASIIQSKGFKDTERQLQQIQKAYNEASAATTKFNQYGKEANEFTPLNAQLGGAAGSMKALLESGALLSHGMQKFFNFIAKSSGRLNAIPANTKLAINAFKALEQQMVRFRSGIIQWTMGVQMAGQAILDPFKKATAGFIEFSDRMGIIASVSNALTSEFHELKNAAILMGATTRFTTEQAAEGLEKLARAGLNVQQQLEMLPRVMRLAQAAATDLATAAEISTVVMNEFRMDPEQFAEATDILALAANRTQATISDLGFGFKYIGALAANVGADFSDLTASLALLHNSGMKGTMAGTALRGMMQRLMNPTKENSKLMAEISERVGGLGLVLQDARGNFVGFSSVLQQLERAGITTGEVLRLFGQRAGPGMAALLAMGSDQLKELEEDLDNASGTASKMADTMENTFKGQLLLMRSAFSALSDSVGMNLSQALMPLASMMADLTNQFIAFRNEFPSLTKALDSLLGGFAVLAVTLGAVAVTWSMIIIPTIQFIKMLRTVAATFFIAAGAMAASTGATTANSAATITNTGAKVANLKVTGAQVAANTGILISTNATTGAIVAQTVAMNANAAASARMILGAIFSARGLAAIGRFLVTNPWGIAITALGTIGILTLNQKKSVEIVNVELQKQREILEFNRREMEILGNKAAATASQIENLTTRLEAVKGDSQLTAEIKLEIKASEAQYQAQLRDIFNRLTDKNSEFRNKFVPILDFDAATGEFTKFQVQIAGTATAFDLLGGSIRERNADLRGLVNVMNEVGKARDQALSLDKLRNVAEQATGQYSFWQKFNPFNRKDLISMDKDITEVERRFQRMQRLLDELAKPVDSVDISVLREFAREFQRITGGSGAFETRWWDRDAIRQQLNDYYSELGSELNTLKSKHQDLVESFARALAENFSALSEEQQNEFQNLDTAGQANFLNQFIDQVVPDAATDSRLRAELEKVVGNAVTEIVKAQEQLQKELAQIKPIDVSRAGGLISGFNELLESAEESIKDRLQEQKELVDRGKALVDEIQKYQTILTEQLSQELSFEMRKIDFKSSKEIGFEIDTVLQDLAADLSRQAIVVENPIVANFKGAELLKFEREFSDDVFAIDREMFSKRASALEASYVDRIAIITQNNKRLAEAFDQTFGAVNIPEIDNQDYLASLITNTEQALSIEQNRYNELQKLYADQLSAISDARDKQKKVEEDYLEFVNNLSQTRLEINPNLAVSQIAALTALEAELAKGLAAPEPDFERLRALRDQYLAVIDDTVKSVEEGKKALADQVLKISVDASIEVEGIKFNFERTLAQSKEAFDRELNKLELEAKVIELPISAQVKDFAKANATVFSSLSRFDTGIVQFERQFSQSIFNAREQRASEELRILRDSLSAQEDVIKKGLATLKDIYKVADDLNAEESGDLNFVTAYETQFQALRKLKQAEYQEVKQSYDAQLAALLELRTKEKQIMDDAIAIRERILRAGETRKDSGADASVQFWRDRGNDRLADILARSNASAKEYRETQKLLQLQNELNKAIKEGDFERAQGLQDNLLSFIDSAVQAVQPGTYLDSVLGQALDATGKANEQIKTGLEQIAAEQGQKLEEGLEAKALDLTTLTGQIQAADEQVIALNNRIDQLTIEKTLKIDVTQIDSIASTVNAALDSLESFGTQINEGLNARIESQVDQLTEAKDALLLSLEDSEANIGDLETEVSSLNDQLFKLKKLQDLAIDVNDTTALAKLKAFAIEWKKAIDEMSKQEVIMNIRLAGDIAETGQLPEVVATGQNLVQQTAELINYRKELARLKDEQQGVLNLVLPVTNFRQASDEIQGLSNTLDTFKGKKIPADQLDSLRSQIDRLKTEVSGLPDAIRTSGLGPELQGDMQGLVAIYLANLDELSTVIDSNLTTTEIADKFKVGLSAAQIAISQGLKEIKPTLTDFSTTVLTDLSLFGQRFGTFLKDADFQLFGKGEVGNVQAAFREAIQGAERLFEVLQAESKLEGLSQERKDELAVVLQIVQATKNGLVADAAALQKLKEIRAEREQINQTPPPANIPTDTLIPAMAQASDLTAERKAELAELEAITRQLTRNEELSKDQIDFLNQIIERRRQEAEALRISEEISRRSKDFDAYAHGKQNPDVTVAGLLPLDAFDRAGRAGAVAYQQAFNEGVAEGAAETGEALDVLNREMGHLLDEMSDAINSANLGSDLAASFEGQELNVPVPELDLASLTPNAGELAALGNNIVAPLAAPIALGIGTAIAESLAADAIIRGVEGLGTWIQEALSPPPLKVEYDTSQLEGENNKLLDVLKGKPVEPVEIKAEPAPGSSEAVGAALVAGAANGARGASVVLEQAFADIINRLAQSTSSAAIELGTVLAATIAAGLSSATGGAVVNIPAEVEVDDSALQDIALDVPNVKTKVEVDNSALQDIALDVPNVKTKVEVDNSALQDIALDVPVTPVIKPKTPEEARHAFIGGQRLEVPVDLVGIGEVDMSDVTAQGDEYSRIFRERAEAQGIHMRVDTTQVSNDLTGVTRVVSHLTASDNVIKLDVKEQIIQQKLREIDAQYQQIGENQGQRESGLSADLVQQTNERMRAIQQVSAMTNSQAEQELARIQEVNAARAKQREEMAQGYAEFSAKTQEMLKDPDPITFDFNNADAVEAQRLVGDIQADLQRLKDAGATKINVTFDKDSGKLIVTADVTQANAQVGAILEKINSSSTVLKLDITAAVSQTQALKSMIDKTTANRTIHITYVETNKPSGGAQGRQNGGIIHRMMGGLIPVQKFAAGGIAKFKKLLSPIVPGSGTGDRVPAMLEPGEFVIRKKAVQGLGTDFLNLLNSGLIQFKNLGGMVESLPLNTLHNLSNMVGSTPNVPQLATDGGGTVNINLKVGDKNFNMKKIPRDQVSQLTNALSYLGRGL